MKAAHFSDWHGKLRRLPEADLYICTGDILPNTEPPPRPIPWPIARDEIPFQTRWIAAARRQWCGIFPNRAPLLIVRGNHDFVDLRSLFDDGMREIYEFGDEPTVWEYRGLRFGGFRGVLEINGMWSDECTERVLGIKCDILKDLGRVDALVTHGPARGYRDLTADGEQIGSRLMKTYLLGAQKPIRHLFGHVHESAGVSEKQGVKLSNASCSINQIKF